MSTSTTKAERGVEGGDAGEADVRYATDVREGRAVAVDVGIGRERFYVTLADGRTLTVPYSASARLSGASAAERATWELIGRGGGIHWELVDEDLSVGGLLRDFGGSRAVEGEARS